MARAALLGEESLAVLDVAGLLDDGQERRDEFGEFLRVAGRIRSEHVACARCDRLVGVVLELRASSRTKAVDGNALGVDRVEEELDPARSREDAGEGLLARLLAERGIG